MITIDVRADIGSVEKYLNALQREQIPYAVGTSLTRTAFFIAKKEREEIEKVFDAPTGFTKSSIKVKKADKRNWEAQVYVNDEGRGKGASPQDVLSHHIFGGARMMKRSEKLLRARGILLPGLWLAPGGGVRLNAAGNISPGVMQKIISALGASLDSAQDSMVGRGKKKRSVNKYAGNIFAIKTKTGHLEPGVYERVGQYRLRCLLMFVRQPYYRKRWDFFRIASAAPMRFVLEFKRAALQELRRKR